MALDIIAYQIDKETGYIVGTKGGGGPVPPNDPNNNDEHIAADLIDFEARPVPPWCHEGSTHRTYRYNRATKNFDYLPDPRVRVRYLDEGLKPVTHIIATVGDPEPAVSIEAIDGTGARDLIDRTVCQLVSGSRGASILPLQFVRGVTSVSVRTDHSARYILQACEETTVEPGEELTIEVRAGKIGD